MKLPDLPRHSGVFVAGTDTGVGKTLVAGAIARLLRREGRRVGVFKPVATGCRHDREGLVSSDAEFLAWCADCEYPLSVVTPVTYATPAAPAACELVERRAVDLEHIANMYQYVCSVSDVVVVEGIGGVRVPISQGVEVLDLAAAMRLPVVVVARPNLGTINHTLLTVGALRGAGLKVAGVVVSGYNAETADAAVEMAPEIIAEYGDVKILSLLPYDPESNVEAGRLGAGTLEVLDQVDWARIVQG
ncbi:MAG TPA: dethiobiotin synthase [Anaerohalosphaeraceae bacterium]|jgi:dethiobiotin synthetase|nr:dethiobiotin synthase [Anaerohalosphaeraceae bacterium]HRT51829.1 dethiobiotin synthase [Anaerohalosphaeraceae bacterium]HRT87847.1 dethiobiotin synthase [Anaerohalosphaeraceae bacterium]